MRNKKFLGVLFVASMMSLSGCSTGTPSVNENTFVIQNEYDSINVSGSSVKKVIPDVAKITFSIRSESLTAEESQSKNTQDTNAVLYKLKELGVAETKIKTYNYQMYQRYESSYNEETGREGERILVGYVVTNSLEVSGLEVDKVGDIITECVQAGINDIDGIDYTYSNYDESYNEALEEAIDVAKNKAESIASKSGVKVGEIKKVDEGSQDTSYRYTNSVMMSKAYDSEVNNSFDAMPGEIEIRANVTCSFAIEK